MQRKKRRTVTKTGILLNINQSLFNDMDQHLAELRMQGIRTSRTQFILYCIRQQIRTTPDTAYRLLHPTELELKN